MKRSLIILSTLIVWSSAPLYAALTQPVKITGGMVSGVAGRDTSITVFKGLPFAAPPVGDLRWHAPKPVVAWPGVKKAVQDNMRTSQYLWAMNRAKTAKKDVFVYYWDHALPGPDADLYGAFHTSEVPYVMNAIDQTVDRKLTAEDHKIADTVSSYWANFIKTGNPNGKGLPHWPSVKEKPAMAFEIGNKYQSIPVAGSPEKQVLLEKAIKNPRPGGRGGR